MIVATTPRAAWPSTASTCCAVPLCRSTAATRRQSPVPRPGAGGGAGFRARDRELELVAACARRLDGLPLAIELAAARLQSLRLDEIADGLDESLAVLRGGRRTVDRHRSVEAALQWSVDLLDPEHAPALHAAAMFSTAFEAGDVATVLGVDAADGRERLGGPGGAVDHRTPAEWRGSTCSTSCAASLANGWVRRSATALHAGVRGGDSPDGCPARRRAGPRSWLLADRPPSTS